MTLAETSPGAAAYLQKVAKGEIRKPSAARIDVRRYIINQDLGVPRQKPVHAGKADDPIEIRWVETILDSRVVEAELVGNVDLAPPPVSENGQPS